MPIKKRKPKLINPRIKKNKVKRNPKLIRHEKECDALYNRLQVDPDDDSLYALLRDITGEDLSPYNQIEHVMRLTDCEVTTLQINYPEQWSFRCHMAYTDRDAKPRHGRIYPRKAVVKTSTRLLHSVMLAYIELCKHCGKFI